MDIDARALDDALADASFSGVVTVDVGDRRILERTEGYLNRPLQVPMTADTQIAVASGSKAFTAVAVMRLVEDGALRLDQQVRALLGEDLPLVDDAVTVEHLLGHTSGIGDYLDEDSGWEAPDYVLTVPPHTLTTAAAFLPLLEGHPQKFAPGERFSYCNSGYMVLALLLERVAGEGYHDVVRRLVLAPAGLEATDFLPLNALPAGAATGYVHDDGDLTNTLHLPVLGNGDGGAFTTAADLHRFWCALLDGRVVSPESVETLTRPRHDVPEEDMRYGLGFWLHRTADVLVLEGYDAGASFRSTHVVGSRTTVSVLGNTSEGAWPVIAALAEVVDASVA
ncbi:CubicO group peptidase, beta-lactamase class C family [Georgenia satyanarayanai]|uniref:CubicO group peptidase, beta-lactamase class C family n=1 Tax=Georgenia satyanarayanai TaxID=860221 RepID=A0A2Y9A4A2_9MICO|nr:serine hydrolase domain-containing protein [Georgenia satyanarayanai]PYG02202.1 CubicO group peptidase (beta-lactamase class C family) [Georgenia satyanarayanai]SSA37037.1 CubicO group peptidase, beta-lactamase class C family [Georgenia satyanarayanai]